MKINSKTLNMNGRSRRRLIGGAAGAGAFAALGIARAELLEFLRDMQNRIADTAQRVRRRPAAASASPRFGEHFVSGEYHA